MTIIGEKDLMKSILNHKLLMFAFISESDLFKVHGYSCKIGFFKPGRITSCILFLTDVFVLAWSMAVLCPRSWCGWWRSQWILITTFWPFLNYNILGQSSITLTTRAGKSCVLILSTTCWKTKHVSLLRIRYNYLLSSVARWA